MVSLLKKDEYRYLILRANRQGMRVDGLVYANDKLIRQIEKDLTIEQVINVATLPGIVKYSLAMPDAHQGYGFAIGGVAAMDAEKGVVSAGGVGFDINCGVRLLCAPFTAEQIHPKLEPLLNQLFQDIPSGTGRRGLLNLAKNQLDRVLERGAKWAVEAGYGTGADLSHIEESGCIPGADPIRVSDHAKERGKGQLGTLGSGNHFLEVQVIDEIYDGAVAAVFGLFKGNITVLIHTGSRGLGHQVCTDYLDVMMRAMPQYGIKVVDRQLACVPINSPEGKNYLSAMAAAANFAFANRQMITHWTRQAFERILGNGDLPLVYDVAHNIAKREEYVVNGQKRNLLVHRKGATRAFPPGHPALSPDYQQVGQPVLIPGSMGTYSYVLVGTELAMEETFGSTCHGAGRAKSRTAAKKEITADQLLKDLRQKGILVKGASKSGLTEEEPAAYKDVTEVVDVVHNAGIARKVARLVPIAVMKG